MLTLKKSFVEPEFSVPYLILVCLAKSSALSIGDSIFVMVKKAAKLAVYEEIMISVKNHHIQLTIRVEIACGAISQPSIQEAGVSKPNITLWIHSFEVIFSVLIKGSLTANYGKHTASFSNSAEFFAHLNAGNAAKQLILICTVRWSVRIWLPGYKYSSRDCLP